MIDIKFVSHHRKAKCQPNPNYPAGIDVDLSNGATDTCKASLPYPADCCGILIARCSICHVSAAITTAGRVDDPRTVKFACKDRGPCLG